MKIKRFFAPDIRQAMNLVKVQLGSEAVILSNRRVDGGIEIVAAIDYDEATVDQAVQVAEATPIHYKHTQGNQRLRAEAYASTQTRPVTTGTAQKKKTVMPNDQAAGARTVRSEPIRANPQARPDRVRAKSFGDLLATTKKSANITAGNAKTEIGAENSHHTNDIVWSQDPAIVHMRKEMEFMRKLLENQLSGMVWGDLLQTQPERVELLKRLNKLGLQDRLSKALTDKAVVDGDAEQSWRRALNFLSRMLPIYKKDLLDQGGVVALVGPTGVGKTTTVAKLAARFALRHGSRNVMLVTTDCYRIGAQEQLLNYGRILDVPVRVASCRQELQDVLLSYADRRLILIDTSGMSQRDMRLSEQLSILQVGNMQIRNFLVLAATTHATALRETIRAFGSIEPEACVLTKVDEAVTLGGALSEVIRHRLPVAYVGDGQRVPEDLHQARGSSLVNMSVKNMGEVADEMCEQTMAMTFGGMTVGANV